MSSFFIFRSPAATAADFSGADDEKAVLQDQTDEGLSTSPGGETLTLEPVVVTATRVPSAIMQTPAAVFIIEKDDIQLGEPTVTLEESLIRSPGVFVQNAYNFAQDLRISIRGFGARSAFGIRGIQIYVDGIPHTFPDGQSHIDSINPSAIERLEVMRGPISALYGNSSGGVINIVTEDGPKEPTVEARQILGEFGLWKSILKGGGQAGRANFFFDVSRLQSEGFREHSETESWKHHCKLRYDLDDSSDLTFLMESVYSPKLKDSGGLTYAQVQEDPEQAGPLNISFDTREEVAAGLIGLKYRRAISKSQNIEAVGYLNIRDLDNSIPYRFIELERTDFGGRMQYDMSGNVFGIRQQLFAGIEMQQQDDDRQNFDNIGGSPGNTILLNQGEHVTNVGVFLQENIKLTDQWSVILGGRYDNVCFEVDDQFIQDGDDSGSKTFDQATGRIGVNYLPLPNVQLYANVAQSFETPTSTELVNRPEGGGGINPHIEPQKAVNYEIGLKGVSGRFTYDASLFYIQLEDELIAFRDATDRVFYRNAGESRRIGAEVGVGLEIAKGLRARLAYTYINARFEDYEKEGVNLGGNVVPGLPEHQVFGEILYDHPSGLYAGTDVVYFSDRFVDDENTLKDGSSLVFNLRMGMKKRVGKWLISPFLGVQNLFDESYSSNVRINASGGRYFEPAPGLNVYGGLGIGYQW